MIKRFTFTLLVICTLFMLSSCVNNMGSMITDYNGNFSVYLPDTYNILNEDFRAEQMLLPEYNVHVTTTLCLVAPDGGVSYEWKVNLVEAYGEKGVDWEEGEELILGSRRYLTLYLKDSDISRWAEYTLTLTVNGPNNTQFIDTAELNVF